MNSLIVKSPAKLNLYLKVLGKRTDGYHEIITLFEKINLCDEIRLTSKAKGIKLKCSASELPKNKLNLAFKAASLLREAQGVKKGVEIEIKKRIPIAAGLGGGSSNAASVLLGLNRLWNLKLKRKSLMELGSKIGADVCFFLSGCKFAIGEDKGNKITPLKISNSLWHIVINPPKGLSTKAIYRGLNLRQKTKLDLTPRHYNVKILIYAINNNNINMLNTCLRNSLESVAQKKYSQIRNIKRNLRSFGLKGLMSGSGPTVFGITANREEAMQVAGKIRAKMNGCKVVVAKTY